MTLFRPDEPLSRFPFKSLTIVKFIAYATIAVASPIITTKGDVKAIREHDAVQDKRLDVHRDSLLTKVDKDTYDRDQKQLFNELHEVREQNTEILKAVLLEKNR